MRKLFGTAAVLMAVSAPAYASVVISGSQAGSASSYMTPAGASAVMTFNTGDLNAEAGANGLQASTTGMAQTFTGYNYNVNGSGNDFFQPEPSDGSAYFGVGKNSSLTLIGNQGYDSVSAFLGSLDNYNLVTLLGATGQAIGSFSGQQIFGASLPFPGTGTPDTNRRVTFSGTGGTQIFGVSFSNTQNLGSFEFDNVAFLKNATGAVPEPTTWALMLGGFGLVGAAARGSRRKRESALLA